MNEGHGKVQNWKIGGARREESEEKTATVSFQLKIFKNKVGQVLKMITCNWIILTSIR